MPDKNFVPNGDKIPKGAAQVSLKGSSAPLMGQSIPGRPAPGQGGGAAPAVPQRTAQLSPAQTPRGAQEVPLAGAPRLGQAAAPQPRPVALGQEGNDVHTIRVEGLGADGRRYKADFDAVFPKGTKITGIGEL
jgi:pyruvate/2-oxoglutarate dehydrogenase complex dihydrolipoamide acyltransferase (E2) component